MKDLFYNKRLSTSLIPKLQESLDRRIKEINEEKGISDEVVKATFQIYNSLVKELKTIQWPTDYNTNGERTVDCSVTTNVFNKQVVLNVRILDFSNNQILDNSNIVYHPGEFNINSDRTYSIDINMVTVGGKITGASHLIEILQHELEHFWEHTCSNSEFAKMNVYQDAIEMMYSDDEFVSAIGNILYMGNRWEPRAHANGVYGYLISQDNPHAVERNVKSTQLYGAIIQIRNDVELLKRNESYWQEKTERDKVLKQVMDILWEGHRLNLSKIIRIGEETLNYMEYVLSRTIQKVKKDLKRGIKNEQKEIVFRSPSFFHPFKLPYHIN